jgi:hypothetical protein
MHAGAHERNASGERVLNRWRVGAVKSRSAARARRMSA